MSMMSPVGPTAAVAGTLTLVRFPSGKFILQCRGCDDLRRSNPLMSGFAAADSGRQNGKPRPEGSGAFLATAPDLLRGSGGGGRVVSLHPTSQQINQTRTSVVVMLV